MRRNFMVASDYATTSVPAQAQSVNGARSGAQLAQTVANGVGCDGTRGTGGAERVVAQREAGRKRRGVRAARSVSGAVRMPLARKLDQLDTVEEQVDGLGAVP